LGDRISDAGKRRVSLAMHFENIWNFLAVYSSQTYAYEKLTKYLLYFISKLAPQGSKKKATKSRRAAPRV